MFERYPEPRLPDKRTAKSYLKNLEYTPSDTKIANFISYLSRAIEAKRILDLGCGITYIPSEIRSIMGNGVEVVCADNNPEILRLARKIAKGSGIMFVEYDVDEPRDIGSFGVVYSIGAFHHFGDLGESLEVIYSMLESPGVLFAADGTRRCPPGLDEKDVPAYTEARRAMVRGETSEKNVRKILGKECKRMGFGEIDSMLADYTFEEFRDAVDDSSFSEAKVLNDPDGRSVLICAGKGNVVIDTDSGVNYFRLFLKKNGLYIPETY